MPTAHKLWPLLCGYMTLDANVMHFGDTSRPIRFPLPAFIIEHDRGLVLIDAGMRPDAHERPAAEVYGEALATAFPTAPITGDAPFPMAAYSKGRNPVLAPPVLADHDLLLRGLDGTVRRFDLDGRQIGTLQLGAPIAAPVAVGTDRVTAIGTTGAITALDTDTAATTRRVRSRPQTAHPAGRDGVGS